MTKAITKNSKKGFTLVELVIVIAILAILAAIAIPVVSSIINTATKNSALSNAETIELAVKNCQADIAARNNEVYSGGEKKYTDVEGNPQQVHDAASNADDGRSAISIAEVAGVNAINDALKQVNYDQATFEPHWNRDTDSCVFVCTDVPDGANTDIEIGDALSSEGVEKGYADSYDDATLVQIATEDTPSTDVMIETL